ncbi:hypothetical protein P3X46_029577 [Hevea brasiliensis]|uniref:Trichome birefringence-like N-terminal domain-containing protein n=1 Tax=Hevea brasiliensis TaxID=3981 RepID=A0ABQ9KU52_HEVBR|nr:protein trichome birefringence-like 19 [Hevea brasiliensis]KAJ9147412.1 hypothetical protein P3X46_029577 [Hevea brasiliensis]
MIKLLLLGLILFLVTIIPLYIFNSSSPWPSFRTLKTINFGKTACAIFQGRWIWYPNRSYYTNATCQEIFDEQSCIKFGRPDTDFLKWRWKPDQCELPLFDANQFLELVRGKSMAFVGDSLARNQMQSLLCLLATVVYPLDVSYTSDSRLKRWFYVNYNFTLASFWSPHLVKAIDTDPNGPTYNRLMNLYLDEANDVWAAQIEAFDYVIISAGRWFYGPQVFFENGKVVGCHLCLKNNIKNLTMLYGYRRVFRTAFKTLMGLENFNGVTFLRTLSPAHFENGEWNRGGNCIRTRPVSRGEMKLEGDDLELYFTQVEELRRAEREGKKRGLKFRLLDINEAMVVRPDGHPNHYGHWPHENVTISDCVHWCLPGPIDTWNDFLLQMLKMERY